MFTEHSLLDAVIRGAVLAVLALLTVAVMIRANGLRSLSKMSPLDFVMTIALGSLVAGGAQASSWSQFVQACAAVLALFGLQLVATRLRTRFRGVESAMGNTPVVLMRDGSFDDEAMRRCRVTRADLTAKLREANVLEFDEVRAVVLEATGDVSVLHGDALDDRLLEGTRDQ